LTRLGVFGGAFDPPHKAHVALARAAIEQLQLDELRIFPTGQAWHRSQALTDAQHRLALVEIAFGELPKTVIDDRELRREGPTYTIDTLRELQAERRGAQLFLVMGEDQALSLTKWREWEAIVQLATICVAERPDAHSHATLAPTGLPAEAEVRLLRLPSMAESATEVRELVARHGDFAHLVPPGVARYIASHHLYQSH
jgi:nicotinate-nucleotide adenylyltransferase